MEKILTRDDVLEVAARLLKADKRRIRIQVKYTDGDNSCAPNFDDLLEDTILPRKSKTIYFIDRLNYSHSNGSLLWCGESIITGRFINYGNVKAVELVDSLMSELYVGFATCLTYSLQQVNISYNSVLTFRLCYYEISVV